MPTNFVNNPSFRAGPTITPRNIFSTQTSANPPRYAPSLITIDGTKSRDSGNSPTSVLRNGLILGKVTSGGKYASSVLGSLASAYSTGTSMTLSVAAATEVIRRVGTSGTFKLTGPTAAAGTVRTLTITYSAGVASTGVMTITDPNVNEVQTVSVDTIVSGGSVNILATKSDGSQSNIEVAYNSSWTQTVADIQTALNAFLGTSAVACAVASTKNMTVTFSGTNYAATAQTLLVADFSAATGPTTVTVVRTTAGVAGAFAAGSIAQPTDGSETPMAILDTNTFGLDVTDISGTSVDQSLDRYLMAADLVDAQIVNLTTDGTTTTDSSVTTWLKSYLMPNGSRNTSGVQYTFTGSR